jgi:uncharacterized membrane-anchored protein
MSTPSPRAASRWTMIAVLVPLLGLGVLVGRAEVATRNAPVWTIPITGVDPRDLLHGQYLEYQYRLRWVATDTCGAPDGPRPTPGCCVCLTRSGADGVDPFAQQIDCDTPEPRCESIVRADGMLPPQRYFVPEASARALEQELRTRDAALRVTATPQRELAVGELLLDGRPWRELVP